VSARRGRRLLCGVLSALGYLGLVVLALIIGRAIGEWLGPMSTAEARREVDA
jgi:hypothetical protein